MRDKIPPEGEFIIHLNLAGLAALMKAVEAAIATGRGRIELGPGSRGIAVSGGTASFDSLTLTFSEQEDDGGGLPLPAPPTGRSTHATQ